MTEGFGSVTSILVCGRPENAMSSAQFASERAKNAPDTRREPHTPYGIHLQRARRVPQRQEGKWTLRAAPLAGRYPARSSSAASSCVHQQTRQHVASIYLGCGAGASRDTVGRHRSCGRVQGVKTVSTAPGAQFCGASRTASKVRRGCMRARISRFTRRVRCGGAGAFAIWSTGNL